MGDGGGNDNARVTFMMANIMVMMTAEFALEK